MRKGTFNLWAFGDCHVGTDLQHGRESLVEALRNSENGGDDRGPLFERTLQISRPFSCQEPE